MSDLDFIQDLSHHQLETIPRSVLEMTCLKMLFLEGNDIETLPDEIFHALGQLQWFDMRNNRLKRIPATIKNHPNLETLLLQNNDIEMLPAELGFVPNLRTIQLSGNPITYPNETILNQGFDAIADFLRNEYIKEQKQKFDQINNADDDEEVLPTTRENKMKPSMMEMPVRSRKRWKKWKGEQQRSKKNKLSKNKLKLNVNNTSNKFLTNTMIVRKNELRVEEKYLKDLWMKKVQNIVNKQNEVIQRGKDLETLKEWRSNKKLKQKKHNSELTTKSNNAPYDSDPTIKLPTRFEYENQKHVSLPTKRQQLTIVKKSTKNINLEKLIIDIIESLKLMEKEQEERQSDKTPRARMTRAGSEIKRIMELQKQLSTLKLTNDQCV